MRSTAWIVLLMAAIEPGGCDRTETPVAPTGNTSTSGPAANAALSGEVVRVADGADLAAVKNPQMIHPQFALTPDEVETPVIFAMVRNDATNAGSPVVLKKLQAGWRIVEFKDSPQQEWVYVTACPGRRELWGVLDLAGDTLAAKLTLVRSTDDGMTWQYFSAVKKIASDAAYAGFSLSKNGVGRLTMHLDEETDVLQHGYYHYATTDGGKTWTGPTFEADDVVPADSLKQFDTLQEAIKSVEAGSN